jgi:hypothetical protein
MLYLVLKNVSFFNNRAVKLVLAPLLIAGCVVAFSQIMSNLQEEMGQYAVESLTKNVKNMNQAYESQRQEGSSMFTYGTEFDGSVSGLVKMAPVFIGTTFFRPFIWESKKVSTMLSSLEGMFFMVFTIMIFFKAGLKTTFQTLTKNPLALYCFLFSLIFALFVGATTLNFGSLCRYKIPCTPFYLIALFLIQDAARLKKENLLIKKQVPL